MIILGIVFIIIGLSLRIAAVNELSKYDAWSNIPKTPAKIVSTGIYRFVGHPAYIGSFIFIFGAFLIVPIEWRFIVEMFVLGIIYKNRIEIENYLLENL